MRKLLSSLLIGASLIFAAATPPDSEARPIRSIARAVKSPDRLAMDVARDAERKPIETLRFFQILPGQTVMDVSAGGGYFTELVARTVGTKGSVIPFNAPPYKEFSGKQLAERDYAKRLPNVTELWGWPDDTDIGENRFDRILIIQGYHDLYLPEGGNWRSSNAEAFRAKLLKALKPGGILGIIDHVAAAGAPREETATKLHRMDPALISAELVGAGFVADGSADFLRNPKDDLSLSAFDPAIRGKTDQVVLRFRKPD